MLFIDISSNNFRPPCLAKLSYFINGLEMVKTGHSVLTRKYTILWKKDTFYEKRAPTVSPALYSITSLNVLHQNKALHNFRRKGQCSIGLENALKTFFKSFSNCRYIPQAHFKLVNIESLNIEFYWQKSIQLTSVVVTCYLLKIKNYLAVHLYFIIWKASNRSFIYG